MVQHIWMGPLRDPYGMGCTFRDVSLGGLRDDVVVRQLGIELELREPAEQNPSPGLLVSFGGQRVSTGLGSSGHGSAEGAESPM